MVTDEKSIDVPVMEEQVQITRTDVDEAVAPGTEGLFQDKTYEMELMGEEVELQKQARVSGQVEIGTEEVERTETLTGTTRREEVDVQETHYNDPNKS